jgi:VanZ family protein
MHQKWVSTRDGNLRDVVIDVSGTLLGWALVRRRK